MTLPSDLMNLSVKLANQWLTFVNLMLLMSGYNEAATSAPPSNTRFASPRTFLTLRSAI